MLAICQFRCKIYKYMLSKCEVNISILKAFIIYIIYIILSMTKSSIKHLFETSKQCVVVILRVANEIFFSFTLKNSGAINKFYYSICKSVLKFCVARKDFELLHRYNSLSAHCESKNYRLWFGQRVSSLSWFLNLRLTLS